MTAARLLVIDDDRDFAGGLALALGLDGHAVDVAADGKRGIQAARDTAYDFVFIDVGLPDMSGVDVLRQVKRIDPTTRCLLLTGYSAEQLLEQGINAGAAEILTKPIDVDDVLRLVAAGKARDACDR